MTDDHFAALVAAQLDLDTCLKRMRDIRALCDGELSVDTRADLAREWGELEQRRADAAAHIRALRQQEQVPV